MNGNATHPPLQYLALACVDSCSDIDAQSAHTFDDVTCARHRLSRTVESDKEAIAGGVDLMAAKAVKFFTHNRMVVRKEFLPCTISESRGTLRRTDDVREKDRL